jgi:hypothetical protein
MQALDASVRVCLRERSNTTLMPFMPFSKRYPVSTLVVDLSHALWLSPFLDPMADGWFPPSRLEAHIGALRRIAVVRMIGAAPCARRQSPYRQVF